ncbi:hypothetical protein [Streptomyces sp. H27-D2]|uniref:hypothetical protein n=1 Tax=Streptomyces sp. H27-D2 TaxID=3046304 RepID=UPI002DBF4703|nr:hypothetical protein [Streptomyces sp. H27-D2]MEC4018293.1 hypothetical protein [Streptomyces sp. H27-D2]
MPYSVTPEDLISRYGLSDVVYFPRHESGLQLHEKTKNFLSSIGLPHDNQFMSRTEGNTVKLSERFTDDGGRLPDECRS